MNSISDEILRTPLSSVIALRAILQLLNCIIREFKHKKSNIYITFVIISHPNEEIEGGRTTLRAITAIMDSHSARPLFPS